MREEDKSSVHTELLNSQSNVRALGNKRICVLLPWDKTYVVSC